MDIHFGQNVRIHAQNGILDQKGIQRTIFFSETGQNFTSSNRGLPFRLGLKF